MKKILLLLALMVSLTSLAGKPEKKSVDMSKYLAGAVPEVEGRVAFSQTFRVPGYSQGQIYDRMLYYCDSLLTSERHIEKPAFLSRITESNEEKGLVSARFEEWLIFKQKFLVDDRTRVYYQLTFQCQGDRCTMEMAAISYLYEADRETAEGGDRFVAEEWITDKEGLNKKKTKLAPISGKFRMKTIDLKNELFQGARHAFAQRKKVNVTVDGLTHQEWREIDITEEVK